MFSCAWCGSAGEAPHDAEHLEVSPPAQLGRKLNFNGADELLETAKGSSPHEVNETKAGFADEDTQASPKKVVLVPSGEGDDHEGRPSRAVDPTASARPRMDSVISMMPGEAYTRVASAGNQAVIEMHGDMYCIRTMHVSYKTEDGVQMKREKTGYKVKVFVPFTATDVVIHFSVVGGSYVYKVDRTRKHFPWVKENGKYVLDTFEYSEGVPQRLLFSLRGTSLRSWVSDIDERDSTQNLLEMSSGDLSSLRTMYVSWIDDKGEPRQFSGSGYNVKCHLDESATNIEVTFSAVGGRNVFKVDRRNPKLPFIKDANGRQPRERFAWSELPSTVIFELRGPPYAAYVASIYEMDSGDQGSSPLAGEERPVWSDAPDLFGVELDAQPGIGGIVDLKTPLSEYALPSEVVLFEPSQNEIFHSSSSSRQIFLNTKLTDSEIEHLKEFKRVLVEKKVCSDEDVLPRYIAIAALRIVQTSKGNWNKAVDIVKACAKERVQRLPLAEVDVLEDMQSGFIYWHGRDKSCRPLLVIRLERIGAMAKDKERAVKAVLFSLEFCLRYLFVPGRVENWVVIVDLENVFSVISPLSVGGLVGVAAAIGTALEKVYCGRMIWVKIVNMPSSMLARAINGVIPSEKKDKVSFPSDVKSAIAPLFEPHQLEQRYGGTAPDCPPSETYPFRFFPRCRGGEHEVPENIAIPPAQPATQSQPLAYNFVRTESGDKAEWRDSQDYSLHELTNLQFHEGTLWDTSSERAKQVWMEAAKKSSLAPTAAEELSKLCGETVEPCRGIRRFLELANPEAQPGRIDRVKTDANWEEAE
mmetsp:Transcript_70939/g.148405  ORF Transcript_70939/g.148405 Transcript_70939/m.148405 type:complete len:811 (+) Transcript_70939:72-2504(+)